MEPREGSRGDDAGAARRLHMVRESNIMDRPLPVTGRAPPATRWPNPPPLSWQSWERPGAYDLPHADGSPSGTFGPQSPTPTGSDPLASDIEVPGMANGAAVSCRSVPNRSSCGFSYIGSPRGLTAEIGKWYARLFREHDAVEAPLAAPLRQPDRPKNPNSDFALPQANEAITGNRCRVREASRPLSWGAGPRGW